VVLALQAVCGPPRSSCLARALPRRLSLFPEHKAGICLELPKLHGYSSALYRYCCHRLIDSFAGYVALAGLRMPSAAAIWS
jgi:hypothetical protein